MATETEARAILAEAQTDARVTAHLSQVRTRLSHGGWRVLAYHSTFQRTIYINSYREWCDIIIMWAGCDAWAGVMPETPPSMSDTPCVPGGER